MGFLKTINRTFFLPFLYYTGLYRFIGGTPKRLRLCYHGVAPNPDFSINNRHMPVEQFERDLKFYKKNYEVITVAEMFKRNIENRPLEKWEVALTFDDGFLNNYTHVKPLLEKHEVPATFYVLSEAITNSKFINWADLVDCILNNYTEDEIYFNGIPFLKSENWKNISGKSLFDYIKEMSSERETALIEFERTYDSNIRKSISELFWRPMNASQILECSTSPQIIIGSHTDLHYNLANIPIELVKTELAKSKEIIENLIGKEVVEIAFPDGSYDSNVKNLAEKSGYTMQLAVSYKLEEDKNDPRILDRFSISNSTTHEGNVIRMRMAN